MGPLGAFRLLFAILFRIVESLIVVFYYYDYSDRSDSDFVLLYLMLKPPNDYLFKSSKVVSDKTD